jgi:single-strand DNA-binding protein
MTKGRLVAVDGRLEARKWTDKDGNNRETIEVVAENVNGLDRPRDGDSQAPATAAATPAPAEDEYDPFADE